MARILIENFAPVLELVPPRFPVELEPDGQVFGPHHAIYGGMAAVVAALLVVDDSHLDPAAVLGLSLAGLFGFLFVWPFYPAVGAALSLGGFTAALAAAVRPGSHWWREYPDAHHAVAAAGLGLAVDDVTEHALGWPTPFDVAWHILGPTWSAAAAATALGLAVYALGNGGEKRDT